jgi:hypothetical protein
VLRLCIAAYRDRGLEREKTSKLRGDYTNMIREQHDVSKPKEIKYFKSDC